MPEYAHGYGTLICVGSLDYLVQFIVDENKEGVYLRGSSNSGSSFSDWSQL